MPANALDEKNDPKTLLEMYRGFGAKPAGFKKFDHGVHTVSWAQPLEVIDQGRDLIEALKSTGNDGAARIVERVVDCLDTLNDKAFALEEEREAMAIRLQAFETLFIGLGNLAAAGERACDPNNRMVALTVSYQG